MYTFRMSVTEASIMGPKGRVVVPQKFREQLDLSEGDELIFAANPHGTLTLMTRHQLVEMVAGAWLTDENLSLVDELFADRRAEAARDQ